MTINIHFLLIDTKKATQLSDPKNTSFFETSHKLLYTYSIPQSSGNERFQVLLFAFFYNAGIGDGRWSELVDQSKKSANAATLQIPMQRSTLTTLSKNITEHFKKLEDLEEIVAIRTAKEIAGEVTL